MIILDSTSESIVAYLAGVVAANQPEFVASYADHTATTFTEGGSEGVLNNTTEVTIVEPPAAATRRAIKSIYIHNKDTATVVVTVEWASGATRRRICKVSLPVDRTLAITEKIEVGQETAIIFSGAVPADNAIARFDGESGWVIQRSLPTIDDAGSINIPAGQTYKINGSSLTLDNILDGATYGRVKLTSLTGNEVVKLTDASGDDLTVALGGANRIITFSGNPTLGDWFDQSVKQASSPAFAGLTLTGFSGFVKATGGILSAAALTDADIPDTITLTNITQITNRSHTNLTDIGTLTHATIDSYLDQAVKQASSPTFVTVKLSGLTDGYLPYHVSDAVGLANTNLFTDGSNIGLGITAFGTSAVRVHGQGSGTAPTTSPADMAQTWVEDISAGRAAFKDRWEDNTAGFRALTLIDNTGKTVDGILTNAGTIRAFSKVTSLIAVKAVSTWTIRTSAADNGWFSVCWSPELGLFVAVAKTGTGNRVMTSPDGINWTIRTSAADNQWLSVCWSPELGIFVAVANTGTGNRVMTSAGLPLYDHNKGLLGKKIILRSGTGPSNTPADAAQMWVEDINAAAGKAGFHMMAESGTGKLIVVGVLIKTDTGDPAQVHEGLMCINTFDNTLKMYCEAAWRQLAAW